MADRIAVGCTLVRGEYNRAWNEVLLTDPDDTVIVLVILALSCYEVRSFIISGPTFLLCLVNCFINFYCFVSLVVFDVAKHFFMFFFALAVSKYYTYIETVVTGMMSS